MSFMYKISKIQLKIEKGSLSFEIFNFETKLKLFD